MDTFDEEIETLKDALEVVSARLINLDGHDTSLAVASACSAILQLLISLRLCKEEFNL